MSHLKVHIQDADTVLYAGDCLSFSSHNHTGSFDILPLHENFICLIDTKIVLEDMNKKKHEYILDHQGVLRVRNDELEVFLGIGFEK